MLVKDHKPKSQIPGYLNVVDIAGLVKGANEGEGDPVRDIQIINDELRLKDLQAIEKPVQEMEKLYVRGNNKTLKAEYECLQKVKANLDEGKHIRFLDWND